MFNVTAESNSVKQRYAQTAENQYLEIKSSLAYMYQLLQKCLGTGHAPCGSTGKY